jgi:hypothetical protein
MSYDSFIYLKLTTSELKEIEQALRAQEQRRDSARKAMKKKQEQNGKVVMTKGCRADPIPIRIMKASEIVNEYNAAYAPTVQTFKIIPS